MNVSQDVPVQSPIERYLVYVAGPLAGAAVAVGIAFILRGRGGGESGSGAGQGALFTETQDPGNP